MEWMVGMMDMSVRKEEILVVPLLIHIFNKLGMLTIKTIFPFLTVKPPVTSSDIKRVPIEDVLSCHRHLCAPPSPPPKKKKKMHGTK